MVHVPSRRPAVPCSVDKLEGPAEPEGEGALDNTSNRSAPKGTAAEQADRVLTPEQKRELTIDTMASWALEGMEPDRQTVENINAYLRGEVTMEEYLRKLKGA